MQEYQGIFREVGASRFEQAVSKIVREGQYKFFPSQAEFRGFIPSKGGWKPCGKCESGFVRVPDLEAEMLYGDPTATKMIFCQCRYGR